MTSRKPAARTGDEKLLKEKAKQFLKKNRAPAYAPDDEGGLVAGPLTKKSMERQAEEQDKQRTK